MQDQHSLRASQTDGAFSQAGITGLETAIILIAFVVVASVFAFTVLSAGIFSSERSKETIYAGVDETKTTLAPRGSTVALSGDVGGTAAVTRVIFNVGITSGGGGAVNLTPPFTFDGTGTDPDASGLQAVTTVSFTDNREYLSEVPWTVRFLGGDNGDYLIDVGEMAEISVWLHSVDTGTGIYNLGTSSDQYVENRVGINDQFSLTLDATKGATIEVQRTIPARLDSVINLK